MSPRYAGMGDAGPLSAPPEPEPEPLLVVHMPPRLLVWLAPFRDALEPPGARAAVRWSVVAAAVLLLLASLLRGAA